MSLWWVKKDQLDKFQLELIETLPLKGRQLILGPPGSGKTNVLLRRAQFVRGQEMPNVLVLTFTRSLTEFVKTGCYDAEGREIFPAPLVTTLEKWLRSLYKQHKIDLPEDGDYLERKRQLASGARGFFNGGRIPLYDSIFVDEAQDLLPEEVELVAQCSLASLFTGDDRQKVHDADGLSAVRKITNLTEHQLERHYRIAPEICKAADRILTPTSGKSLASTGHYVGPRPGTIDVHGPLSREEQLEACTRKLTHQVRVYGDLIKGGDRLGVVVARTADREIVWNHFEQDPVLVGKSKIIRAKEDEEDTYDPSFDPDVPICIVTVKGCKGLEFRAVHWLFTEELSWHQNHEHYYTVVTRAKTSLDLYFKEALPEVLAGAYAPPVQDIWQ